MDTWETTLRLVHSISPSPILLGLVIEELEEKIRKLCRHRTLLSEEDMFVYRGYILKRFVLCQKLHELIDGTKNK